jgi:hypothetical protein
MQIHRMTISYSMQIHWNASKVCPSSHNHSNLHVALSFFKFLQDVIRDEIYFSLPNKIVWNKDTWENSSLQVQQCNAS